MTSGSETLTLSAPKNPPSRKDLETVDNLTTASPYNSARRRDNPSRCRLVNPVAHSPNWMDRFYIQTTILRSAINDFEPMKCLLANTWMNPDIEPQEFPHQAKACQSSEAEPSHPSVDSPQDW